MKTKKQIKKMISQRTKKVEEISSLMEAYKGEDPIRYIIYQREIFAVKDEISLLNEVLK